MNIILEKTIKIIKSRLRSEIDTITVDRAVLGLFFTGVRLSTGHGGLCFTPVKEMPEAVCCPSSARAMPLSGRLSGKPVSDYLEYVVSDNPLKKALGIAALNALSSILFERGDYDIRFADAFDETEPADYDRVTVVGALVPIIKKLIAAGSDFSILELDPKTLKEHEMKYFVPADKAGTVIPYSDLLVITGVTILNDTLPQLLEMAKPDTEITVTGPTAGMIPDVLFDMGVTMVGGILVTDADRLLDIIAEGGSGYHFFGRYAERIIIKNRAISR